MPNSSFLSGSNILVRGGVGGWLHSDYNASLSSNWTSLELQLELSLAKLHVKVDLNV